MSRKMIKSAQQEYLLNTASGEKWKRIGWYRRSGVLVALFSLYSKKSIGIGEFPDLKLLIEWAKKTGNSIIQLLPMNELGALFCPYDSISSFALEPAYLSLDAIAGAKDRAMRIKINDLRKNFASPSAYVDYAIKKEKMRLLREIYPDATKPPRQRQAEWRRVGVPPNREPLRPLARAGLHIQDGLGDLIEFKKFQAENAYWLNDFSLYKSLKDYHQGCAWWDWEDKYKNRDELALRDFRKIHQSDIDFQDWVQWLCFQQFREVKKFAEAKNIFLKGDLPILVSRDSADVWAHPDFFKLEFAAGAPPDMYCAKGQRWGMPSYNWERIFSDDFRYLKEKLRYAGNFYDILRIDHVVGLFRIWSIPYDEPLENKGLNGFFDPKDEHKWAGRGRKILTAMLNASDVLLCAEDLGVIPKLCPATLKELGIPGNDVQRWVKDWKIKHDFLRPEDYRFLSVAMLSTHDTTNWPAWWEYEAGTVDEELFMRRCKERGIDYTQVKNKLFDPGSSRYGRLRWLRTVNSVELLVDILGKRREEIADFIEMYENSFREKEKLWRQMNLAQALREKSDPEIVKLALKISLDASSTFCINTIIDLLYLADIFKDEPYQYRINKPATISEKNWAMVVPIALEDLLRHKVNKEIREMNSSSGRI